MLNVYLKSKINHTEPTMNSDRRTRQSNSNQIDHLNEEEEDKEITIVND